jgi:hypothetical protein
MPSDYITLHLDEHGNHDTLILRADDISAVRVNKETGRVAFSAAHPHNLMGHAGEAMSLVGQPAKDFLDQWSKAVGVKADEVQGFEPVPTAAGMQPNIPPGPPLTPGSAPPSPGIDTLGLDPKVAGALKAEKYRTVADLHGATDDELDAIEGVGPAKVKDIRAAVKKAGH